MLVINEGKTSSINADVNITLEKPKPKCEFSTDASGNPIYKYDEVVLTDDASSTAEMKFLNYGCCKTEGFNNDYLKNDDAKEKYTQECGPLSGCTFEVKDGTPVYKKDGVTLSGEMDYLIKGCCKINNGFNYSYLVSDSAKAYYNNYCNSSAACERTTSGGKSVYKWSGNVVSETEYINKGCCDVEYDELSSSGQELYKNFCQQDDEVKFEYECGTKTILGSKVDKVGDTDITLSTCTNDSSYVDYSNSYVHQMSINNVLNRVKVLENSAYIYSLSGIYNSSAISNYMDKTYLSKSISYGGQSYTISARNNYCMLYTSEDNDIHFPGTAISTSGNYFVFNELKRSECTNSESPNDTCYRQPYVEGKIHATMHTNYTKWKRDYEFAIAYEESMYNIWKETGTNSDKGIYDAAVADRKLLETYKLECESHNNLASNWNYEIEPKLDFKYTQKYYENSSAAGETIDEVPMEISYNKVKYWPNISTKPEIIAGSSSGTAKSENFTIKYGTGEDAVNETTSFDANENYSIGYQAKLYYKPSVNYYQILEDGTYVKKIEEYTATGASTEVNNNGVKLGKVYAVKLTTYSGAYTTSFTIDNVGHLGKDSNIQKILDDYKNENGELTSECVYCNQESENFRECDGCNSIIYRPISLTDVVPNARIYTTNWSDDKGIATKSLIQSLSGESIVAALTSEKEKIEAKITTLDEINTSDLKIESIAKDIYDDNSKEYLEYEFTLTTKDMEIIRKNTQSADFDYGKINMCTGVVSSVSKSASEN